MRARIEADIQGWDSIHDHRTGTEGDQATAEWLAEAVRGAGGEPCLEAFPFERRVLHECSVTSNGQRAEGVPLFDGGLTDASGVAARLSPLEDEGDHIGVTSFSSSGADPASRRLAKARRGEASGIVAHSGTETTVPGLALLNAPSYGRPFGPPVLQVATEHGAWLEEAAREGAPARLVAHATVEATTVHNVATTVPGSNESLKPLVVLTPRSAWWTCTAERGGGITAWLECLRRFASDPAARTVIFVATTGHELGHVGLAHHMRAHPSLGADAHAWIHLGANFAATDARTRYQASPEFLRLGLDALEAEDVPPDSVTPTGTPPVGEAHNVFDAGGRYVSLLGAQRWFHHPDDRWPDTIDLARTERLCRAVLRIAEGLAEAPREAPNEAASTD